MPAIESGFSDDEMYTGSLEFPVLGSFNEKMVVSYFPFRIRSYWILQASLFSE